MGPTQAIGIPEHPHELYEIAVWILSVIVPVLIGLVGKLWFNHQKHFREGMDVLRKSIETARTECRELITTECDKTRADIKILYDRTSKHGEQLARLEAKGG